MIEKMNNPLVSVIMVVKNGEHFIKSAVESVFKQIHQPMEIIVVDGQSNDRTAEIAKTIQGVKYIYQHDQGLANARNKAIELSMAKFIAFLDYDDIWLPNKLSKQIDHLVSFPDIQATITWLRFIIEPEYFLQYSSIQNNYQKDQIGYTPSALVARKELFQKIGLFDPVFSSGCDLDWFAKLTDSNYPISIIPEVLLYKRIHDSNLSLNISQNKKEMMLVLRNSLIRKRNSKSKNG